MRTDVKRGITHRTMAVVTGVLVLAGALGCGSTQVPLTQELRTRHALSAEDLQNLQYYNSHEITLRRVVRTNSKQITDGHKLVLRSGQRVEEVVIQAGTPGVAVDVGADFMTVSFEPDTALTFSLRGADVPDWALHPDPARPRHADPFPGNPHQPADSAPSGHVYGSGAYWLHRASDDNRLPFAGKWFEAVEDSFESQLLIDAEALEDEEEQERVLSGVKL